MAAHGTLNLKDNNQNLKIKKMKRKIVILGATGTVGSKISKNLLSDGHHVTLIARNIERLKKFQDMGAEIISGDVNDVEILTNAFKNAERAYLILPDNL